MSKCPNVQMITPDYSCLFNVIVSCLIVALSQNSNGLTLSQTSNISIDLLLTINKANSNITLKLNPPIN